MNVLWSEATMKGRAQYCPKSEFPPREMFLVATTRTHAWAVKAPAGDGVSLYWYMVFVAVSGSLVACVCRCMSPSSPTTSSALDSSTCCHRIYHGKYMPHLSIKVRVICLSSCALGGVALCMRRCGACRCAMFTHVEELM